MTGEVDELREIIAADLEALANSWRGQIDWHQLRREAIVLRRLLTEGGHGGDIAKFCRLVGRPVPTVEAGDLSAHPRTGVLYATADPVRIDSFVMHEACHRNAAATVWPPIERRAVALSKYAQGVCAIVDSTPIRRSDLIGYVANKAGGAHYDRSRDPRRKAAFLTLDSVRASGDGSLVSSTGWSLNPVFAQLLAIGQAVSSSAEVRALVT